VSLAEDALRQLRLLLKTIQDIVEALVPKKKHDDIAALIQNLAKLVASGTEAAIAGAIAALVEAVDSDASAKDIICVPGPNGEVTIWFRVRKGCLILFDFLVSDDYVYIHKTAKGATPTFATGESAKEIRKKVQEKLTKELEGGGGAGAAAAPKPEAPAPAAPAPAAPPPPQPTPPQPAPPAKPGAGDKFF
jgi:pyruvate/2-oxoglutarate dehydrogenase complex dihydrolipoamide acyltransferase (E2) component